MIDNEREENVTSWETNDRRGLLNIVNALRLGETTSNLKSLVTCNGTIKNHLHVTMLALARQQN